jgi:hypothetical protein
VPVCPNTTHGLNQARTRAYGVRGGRLTAAPWRNPWNNFQVSRNPCIKIIIYAAHGTLAWSISCRYNNPIIIVNALLSREWYFSVDLFILANKFKKQCLFFSITISRGSLGLRGTPVEKPCFRGFIQNKLTVLIHPTETSKPRMFNAWNFTRSVFFGSLHTSLQLLW